MTADFPSYLSYYDLIWVERIYYEPLITGIDPEAHQIDKIAICSVPDKHATWMNNKKLLGSTSQNMSWSCDKFSSEN